MEPKELFGLGLLLFLKMGEITECLCAEENDLARKVKAMVRETRQGGLGQ